MSFVWQGQNLGLFDHPYNQTATNERAVEIPAAMAFLTGCTGRGLEVGNVLGHYDIAGHDVVDLYENAPGVANIDVFDVTGTWDWIVSISTIEHLGWDIHPRDPHSALHAVEHLRSLLAPDGRMFISIPLGYHPLLDRSIASGEFDPAEDAVYVRRPDGSWDRRARTTWRPYRGHRADAVWIATWGPS